MTSVFIGTLENGSAAFAAVDPQAHHVGGAVAERRFSAFLTPFANENDARLSLKAVGAGDIKLDDRRKTQRHG